MSSIGGKLKEVEKNAKRTRRISTILATIMIIFIALSAVLIILVKKANTSLEEEKQIVETQKKQLEAKNEELAKKDSLLTFQNERLREVQGKLDNYWNQAVSSNKINAYADYLSKAINGDEHYNDALSKMNELANKTGYVQITDSNKKQYLSPIKELDSDVQFYIAKTAMRVRRGVMGDPNYSNTSQIGNKVVRVNDVVRLDSIIKTGDAEWGKIGYGN